MSRTGVVTITVEVENEDEATVLSIEPRGLYSGDTGEPTKPTKDGKHVGCGCQKPETFWDHIASDELDFLTGRLCDACAVELSIDTVGIDSFLRDWGLQKNQAGTLVVKGWMKWTSYSNYDGDDYDEEFNVESEDWQPASEEPSPKPDGAPLAG